jgi:hypothetical protein
VPIQTRKKRKGQTSKDAFFFNWEESGTLRYKGRSHSIILELYNAANKARIGINFDNRTKLMAILAKEDKNNIRYCKKEKQHRK